VTFCPDLLTHINDFDYNRITNALNQHELSIENVTNEELVSYTNRSESRHEFDFRLKYMQAVALVTGDEFLVSFNMTIDANDVLDYIKKLTWKWFDRRLVNDIGFDDFYGIYFADIIGSSGICYSFNIVVPEKIFHLEKS
jgi:hypothetical protein